MDKGKGTGETGSFLVCCFTGFAHLDGAAQQAGDFVELRCYLDYHWLGDDAEVLGDAELGFEFRQ